MESTIIYTVCTAAYLSQAKSLGDSITQNNPGCKLYIGLVDKIDKRIDCDFFLPHQITEVDQLSIPQFREMQKRYSLLELSCALKPWFALFFMEKFAANQAIYFDTDILVFSSLKIIDKEFDNHSILLTPQILSPFPDDGKRPHETSVLKTGIYNAGFFGVKNDENGLHFLNWWRNILVDHCFEDGKAGLSSDQSWLNFVPLFFDGVNIIRHPGCNAAYWNLHERKIEKSGDVFLVNYEPLIFYHFSGYSVQHPELISKHQDRFKMNEFPAVKELFDIYRSRLFENKYDEMTRIPCVYKKKKWFV
ncbi:MAG TPA: hypothetical protein PKC72_03040 [Chitinophagaceae bacterium]|nr:hypothetical protein [Chitinophagaceae bacterium]